MAGLWPTVLTVRERGQPDRVMRALRPRDRNEWERLRLTNREWLEPWEATSPNPAGPMRFRALVRHYEREAQAGRLQPFVIEVGGRLVGQMHLFGITWGSLCSGSAGYWVARSMAGQGIAPLCLAALVDHAVYGLGLHRVEVNVRPENVASLRVVQKLGFRDEGVRQRYLHIGGAWRDHRTFAITTEDLSGGSLVAQWHARNGLDLHASARPVPPGESPS
ncbi:GNAT family N-acetyltransferase [Gephyromycinifex aptenodytis]|uniref:GNAT family N-acetyltransferase n=1 Tax=Gephyromycinifex aptenodytis TaxID=2716227 RepID=UPI001446225B|nr:GNAT family protein [Gephyromycinifex aptenodytis]